MVALSGIAGCTSNLRNTDGVESASPTAGEPKFQHIMDSPESTTLREAEGEPAVRSPTHSPEEDMFESSAAWDYEDWLVKSRKEAELLNFSSGADHVAEVRDFIATTDLSAMTLLVHQYNIATCEMRKLNRLKWDSDFSCGDQDCVGIHLKYEMTTRDGECQDYDANDRDGPPYSGDQHASEATFVRIPAQIQSYGRFSVQV